MIAFEALGVVVVHAAARWEIAGTSPCDATSEFTRSSVPTHPTFLFLASVGQTF